MPNPEQKRSMTQLFGNPQESRQVIAPVKDAPIRQNLPKPSPQQQAILETRLAVGESMKVIAKAGAGKTTSMLMFSESKGENARILYICFNTKGAEEARRRYQGAGIRNTEVLNVHRLATGVKKRYEDAEKFKSKITIKDARNHNPRLDYSRAWTMMETIKNFCESDKTEIEKSHVPTIAYQDRPNWEALLEESLKDAQLFWKRMLDLKDVAPVSFDHYLKIYELGNPKLNYDFILLDEGQDSNPITINLLKKQADHTRIVLIGDPHQAIYKWRGAKNAMAEWDSKITVPLSESFRFGPEIAAAANVILKVFSDPEESIQGNRPMSKLGVVGPHEKHTLIARTNGVLFETALEQVAKGRKFHFVGTEASKKWDPSIPYRFDDAIDVFQLMQWSIQQKAVAKFSAKVPEKPFLKNPHLRAFKDYDEIKQAAVGENGAKGDKELESLCRIVEKYPTNLPILIERVIKNCTSPEEANILLSTCHQAKGLEWPVVKMADDFTELVTRDDGAYHDRLVTAGNISDDNPLSQAFDTDDEEINLIYVAITRAIEKLELNPKCLELFRRTDLLPKHILNDPEFQKYLGGGQRRQAPRENPKNEMFQDIF